MTVHPEAAFLAGYALVLTVVAGLGWVGRRNTDPWSSRGCSPPADVEAAPEEQWNRIRR